MPAGRLAHYAIVRDVLLIKIYLIGLKAALLREPIFPGT